MSNSCQQEKFTASMSNLQPGDLLSCIRSGVTQYSVVLARHENSGRAKFALSTFNPVIAVEPYPREVSLDPDGWLVDDSGRIVLLPEEWASTEKEGAKSLISEESLEKYLLKRDKRAKTIVMSLADPRRSLIKNADDILRAIYGTTPSTDAIKLMALALHCTAKRIWEQR